MMAHLFDYILAGLLILLSVLILRSRDLFVSIILFIIFGMFVALAWVQLKAPDIALVEVVIGSALTGALFLGSLAQIESSLDYKIFHEARTGMMYKTLFGVFVCAVGGMLVKAMALIQPATDGLKPFVDSVLSQSGVSNPVTAVVLNIRGYDTLLEIGVLLITVIAVFALNKFQPLQNPLTAQKTGPVLKMFVGFLSPIMILIGMYLLWVGAKAPGGAFQAGAMFSGAGILMLISSIRLPLTPNNLVLRLSYVAGLFVFIFIGLTEVLSGKHFLTMSFAQAKLYILLIEVAATVSIAVILLTLFAGCAGFLEYHNKPDLSQGGHQ